MRKMPSAISSSRVVMGLVLSVLPEPQPRLA
jgi:hypothetical protein